MNTKDYTRITSLPSHPNYYLISWLVFSVMIRVILLLCAVGFDCSIVQLFCRQDMIDHNLLHPCSIEKNTVVRTVALRRPFTQLIFSDKMKEETRIRTHRFEECHPYGRVDLDRCERRTSVEYLPATVKYLVRTDCNLLQGCTLPVRTITNPDVPFRKIDRL